MRHDFKNAIVGAKIHYYIWSCRNAWNRFLSIISAEQIFRLSEITIFPNQILY